MFFFSSSSFFSLSSLSLLSLSLFKKNSWKNWIILRSELFVENLEKYYLLSNILQYDLKLCFEFM